MKRTHGPMVPRLGCGGVLLLAALLLTAACTDSQRVTAAPEPVRYSIMWCSWMGVQWQSATIDLEWMDSSGTQCEVTLQAGAQSVWQAFTSECPPIHTVFTFRDRTGAIIGTGVADWQGATEPYWASVAIP